MTDFNTQFFKMPEESENRVQGILKEVYSSLQKKGYDPTNQMVGYLISDDPTYITSYDNSRAKISKVSRDEILEELVRSFVKLNHLDGK